MPARRPRFPARIAVVTSPTGAALGAGLMFFSLAGAYLLVVMPWSGAWVLVRPDFVLLVLLFWALHEPRSIGQGIAFALGLLMDVSDSMLLGQHAFAYVVAIYGAQVLRVRILTFRLPEQTLHMLGIVLASSAGVLVSTLGKTPQATRSVGIFVVLIATMLGGAWFPSFLFPSWLQPITR